MSNLIVEPVTVASGASDDSIITPLTQQGAEALINQIRDLAYSHWSNPDWEGLMVVLAFLGGYFLHETNPFWLHLVGPSSSGKTSLGFSPVHKIGLYAHQVDDITASALLSGYSKGNSEKSKRHSLLHRIGSKGIIYSPDFSNLLSKDRRVVEEVATTLRQVWDGSATKNVGVGGKTVSWEGRISCIAAMTPDRIRYWDALNPGGPRFLNLQWRGAADPVAIAEKVASLQAWEARTRFDPDKMAQLESEGPGGKIRDLTRRLVADLDMGLVEKPLPPLSPDWLASLSNLSRLIALTRSQPSRPDGRNISRAENTEDSGRVQHQLLKVARGMAYLRREEEPDARDLALMQRVALDTIPSARFAVLSPFPVTGQTISLQEILFKSRYQTYDALIWEMASLAALGIATPMGCDPGDGDMFYRDARWRLTDSFAALVSSAFPAMGLADTFGELQNIADGDRNRPFALAPANNSNIILSSTAIDSI